VRTGEGRLPRVSALAAGIVALGAGATLRGVEADVEGELHRRGDSVVLRVGETGEEFVLAPLTRKIQWHPRRKRLRRPSADERGAYRRLISRWKGEPRRVRIVGPLVESGAGQPMALEVRKFEWVRAPNGTAAPARQP